MLSVERASRLMVRRNKKSRRCAGDPALNQREIMCDEAYIADLDAYTSTIGELEAALEIKATILPDYGRVPARMCLCPVDMAATARISGRQARPPNHDPGDHGFYWVLTPDVQAKPTLERST